jgi:hypothetical protein
MCENFSLLSLSSVIYRKMAATHFYTHTEKKRDLMKKVHFLSDAHAQRWGGGGEKLNN